MRALSGTIKKTIHGDFFCGVFLKMSDNVEQRSCSVWIVYKINLNHKYSDLAVIIFQRRATTIKSLEDCYPKESRNAHAPTTNNVCIRYQFAQGYSFSPVLFIGTIMFYYYNVYLAWHLI